MTQSSKIIWNTGILYGKAAITIVVALFTTRYVLNALGENDFGIYSLIGGVFAFLAFLNSAMASSTQRFLSYNRNEGGGTVLATIFNTSVFLHFLIGILLIIAFEIAAFFLFSGILNIDPSRIGASKIVYHCMVASTFIAVISGPYDASITAHENMAFYAAVGLFESIGKLLISLYLYCTSFDRLEVFGFLMAGLSICTLVIKRIYCWVHYPETRIRLSLVNRRILREITGFSVWTTLETLFHIFRDQGMTVLLNVFYGVSLNASYGVAKQVGGQIAFFSNVIFKASSPQIVSHVSQGASGKALEKTLSVCKLSFLLMALFSIPLIVEMPFVLEIWLKNVPAYTAVFCRLTLVATLVYMIGAGLNYLIEGIGEIRTYRIVSSGLSLLSIIVAILFVKLGYPPYAIFVGIISSNIGLVMTMVHFTIRHTDLTWKRYLTEIVLKMASIVSGVTAFLFWIPYPESLPPLARLACTIAASSLLLAGFSWFALNPQEKAFTGTLVKRVATRMKWRQNKP